MKLAIIILQVELKKQRDLLTAIQAEVAMIGIFGTEDLGLIYLSVSAATSDNMAELKQAIEILKDELSS